MLGGEKDDFSIFGYRLRVREGLEPQIRPAAKPPVNLIDQLSGIGALLGNIKRRDRHIRMVEKKPEKLSSGIAARADNSGPKLFVAVVVIHFESLSEWRAPGAGGTRYQRFASWILIIQTETRRETSRVHAFALCFEELNLA